VSHKPLDSAVDLSAKQIQSSIGLICFFLEFVLLKGHGKSRLTRRGWFFWARIAVCVVWNSAQVHDLEMSVHAPALTSQAQVMQLRFELLWLLQL
jgi:hypothetical protein